MEFLRKDPSSLTSNKTWFLRISLLGDPSMCIVNFSISTLHTTHKLPIRCVICECVNASVTVTPAADTNHVPCLVCCRAAGNYSFVLHVLLSPCSCKYI